MNLQPSYNSSSHSSFLPSFCQPSLTSIPNSPSKSQTRSITNLKHLTLQGNPGSVCRADLCGPWPKISPLVPATPGAGDGSQGWVLGHWVVFQEATSKTNNTLGNVFPMFSHGLGVIIIAFVIIEPLLWAMFHPKHLKHINLFHPHRSPPGGKPH